MAADLARVLARLDTPATAVVLASLSRSSLEAVASLRRRSGHAGTATVTPADTEAMLAWFTDQRVDAPSALAAELAAAGVDPQSLSPLAEELDADSLGRILEWLPARLEADRFPARLAAGAAAPGGVP